MPYKAKGNCVYKQTKDGKLGAKVGCSKGDVKQYLKALYAADAKAAKNELAGIVEAFGVDKQKTTLTNELNAMKEQIKQMYETMTHESYEKDLSEIEKMHNSLKTLWNDVVKLER